MNKEILVFGDIGIDKHWFHYPKHPTLIDDEDIDKTLISNKVSFCKKEYKYLIGYKEKDSKSKLLCIMLPGMNDYMKSFDKTKCMSFY